MSGLFEPDDTVRLRVVRAYRVLSDDIYWGTEMDSMLPRKGFVIESEGVPVPYGAVPVNGHPEKVHIASFMIDRDALVLIQDVRR